VRVEIRSRFVAIALICCAIGASTWFGLRWWPAPAPQDYEECSEAAAKAVSSNDERALLIAQCDKQFVGRRRPGGGYTYFDFLQNRRFDIAGPNPTPEEQKNFDQEYIAYLNAQRRDAMAAALAEKQRAEADVQNERFATGSINPPGAPLAITPNLAIASNNVQPPKAASQVARSKAQRCEPASLSCSWTKFSAGIKNFFGSYAKVNQPQ
jgi:hypothetical protein